MPISTANLLANTNDPKLARLDLLAAVVLLNALTDQPRVWTKNQCVTPVPLTDAATIATDASLSNNFRVTLTATRVLDNPTNLTDGMVLNWKIINGGAFNLTYGSKFKWDGGVAPTLTSGAGKVDLISGIYYADDGFILCAIGKDKR